MLASFGPTHSHGALHNLTKMDISKKLNNLKYIFFHQKKAICSADKKCGTLHDFACHPCAGAMLIFSVSFQF